MSESLLARLEAAIARLEKLGGSAAVAEASSGDDISSPASRAAVAAYEEFYTSTVVPFLAACDAYPDLKDARTFFEAAFKNQGDLIKAAGVSKKASDADLLAFLKPSADAIGQSDKMNFKSAQYAHQQAINNSIGFLSWPFSSPPATHIEGMLDSGMMYLNRILMKAKDAEEPQKTNDRAFVATYKAVLNNFLEFIKSNFKAGLEWNNVKGGALSAYSGAGSAPVKATVAPVAAPVATPAPVAAAPKVAGLGAVFGELSKGLAVTSGLKKVTDDMKAKNMKDVPPAEVKSVAPKAAVAPKVVAVKKAPVFEEKNGSWFVENYENDHTLEVKDVTMRTGVYLGNLRNCTVKIFGKAKSVALDKCFRVSVQIVDVLSSVELVNCDRTTVYISGTCPTLAIDKSKGVVLNLSETAIAANPDIVTSNISECNIQIPGPSEEENITEIPLAEQFISKLVGKKVTTNPVSHG